METQVWGGRKMNLVLDIECELLLEHQVEDVLLVVRNVGLELSGEMR